ncbi:hypothetical protein WICPIJ_002323 [Wickerhamomyces pijperi]|uniref:Uncharacterized protein n=1 Tax=Wickerhamomyces pijperi TaxID=599730 RepID=A0A9P8QC20_WICPI|nr:hypothetical protein WICPIJ_002323 [Wickerhamomyces pijperi]
MVELIGFDDCLMEPLIPEISIPSKLPGVDDEADGASKWFLLDFLNNSWNAERPSSKRVYFNFKADTVGFNSLFKVEVWSIWKQSAEFRIWLKIFMFNLISHCNTCWKSSYWNSLTIPVHSPS